jgi:DNA-binding MarR family transcriptional regulator
MTKLPLRHVPLALPLLTAARHWDELAQAVVNLELGEAIARPAMMRLLPWLEAGPIRVTDLARRADVSKQAVGQALSGCEARGWVVYAPDPSDGRASLVSLTPLGFEAVAHGRAVLARIEAVVEDTLGSERVLALGAALQQVAEILAGLSASALATAPSAKARRKDRR